MTERLVTVGGDAPTPERFAAALAQVFADEYGFVGDRVAYGDHDKADLIHVMERRRGLPVSLSILHVAAAWRVGWQAHALNTPGHVLARIGPDTTPNFRRASHLPGQSPSPRPGRRQKTGSGEPMHIAHPNGIEQRGMPKSSD